jgi:tetratricopeptide (TPR) repeat protein
MKRLILLLNFACFAFSLHAQQNVIDTTLKFYQGYQEKKWVVLKKADTTSSYTFGYIYIDTLDGFIFQKEGTFKVGKKNRYIRDSGNLKKHFDRTVLYPPRSFMMGSILLPRPMASISDKHFKELKIQAEPDWVKPYYNYTDTLAYNYRLACIYGNASYTYDAIDYLQKIYKVNPHYIGVKQKLEFGYYLGSQGVELKLAWAYNSLDQSDKAITILNAAIKHDAKNPFFFYVLGWSYELQKNGEAAVNTYKQGLQLMGTETQLKANLAYGISNSYQSLHRLEEAKKWRAMGDQYNPHPGRVD